MQTIGLITVGRVSWSQVVWRGGTYDSGTVQGPGDRGDSGAPLRGWGAGDRGAGEARVRRVPGSLQVALRADLVHRLRAAGSEGGSGCRSGGLGAGVHLSPSGTCGGLL